MANISLTTFDQIAPKIKNDGTKKLGNNTWAQASDDGSVIVVRLHGNAIVKLHRDGRVEVNLCGWHTLTTRDRLSQFVPGVRFGGNGPGSSMMWVWTEDSHRRKRVMDYNAWELVYSPETGVIWD